MSQPSKERKRDQAMSSDSSSHVTTSESSSQEEEIQTLISTVDVLHGIFRRSFAHISETSETFAKKRDKIFPDTGLSKKLLDRIFVKVTTLEEPKSAIEKKVNNWFSTHKRATRHTISEQYFSKLRTYYHSEMMQLVSTEEKFSWSIIFQIIHWTTLFMKKCYSRGSSHRLPEMVDWCQSYLTTVYGPDIARLGGWESLTQDDTTGSSESSPPSKKQQAEPSKRRKREKKKAGDPSIVDILREFTYHKLFPLVNLDITKEIRVLPSNPLHRKIVKIGLLLKKHANKAFETEDYKSHAKRLEDEYEKVNEDFEKILQKILLNYVSDADITDWSQIAIMAMITVKLAYQAVIDQLVDGEEITSFIKICAEIIEQHGQEFLKSVGCWSKLGKPHRSATPSPEKETSSAKDQPKPSTSKTMDEKDAAGSGDLGIVTRLCSWSDIMAEFILLRAREEVRVGEPTTAGFPSLDTKHLPTRKLELNKWVRGCANNFATSSGKQYQLLIKRIIDESENVRESTMEYDQISAMVEGLKTAFNNIFIEPKLDHLDQVLMMMIVSVSMLEDVIEDGVFIDPMELDDMLEESLPKEAYEFVKTAGGWRMFLYKDLQKKLKSPTREFHLTREKIITGGDAKKAPSKRAGKRPRIKSVAAAASSLLAAKAFKIALGDSSTDEDWPADAAGDGSSASATTQIFADTKNVTAFIIQPRLLANRRKLKMNSVQIKRLLPSQCKNTGFGLIINTLVRICKKMDERQDSEKFLTQLVRRIRQSPASAKSEYDQLMSERYANEPITTWDRIIMVLTDTGNLVPHLVRSYGPDCINQIVELRDWCSGFINTNFGNFMVAQGGWVDVINNKMQYLNQNRTYDIPSLPVVSGDEQLSKSSGATEMGRREITANFVRFWIQERLILILTNKSKAAGAETALAGLLLTEDESSVLLTNMVDYANEVLNYYINTTASAEDSKWTVDMVIELTPGGSSAVAHAYYARQILQRTIGEHELSMDRLMASIVLTCMVLEWLWLRTGEDWDDALDRTAELVDWCIDFIEERMGSLMQSNGGWEQALQNFGLAALSDLPHLTAVDKMKYAAVKKSTDGFVTQYLRDSLNCDLCHTRNAPTAAKKIEKQLVTKGDNSVSRLKQLQYVTDFSQLSTVIGQAGSGLWFTELVAGTELSVSDVEGEANYSLMMQRRILSDGNPSMDRIMAVIVLTNELTHMTWDDCHAQDESATITRIKEIVQWCSDFINNYMGRFLVSQDGWEMALNNAEPDEPCSLPDTPHAVSDGELDTDEDSLVV